MFAKPYKLKSNNTLKNSEKKHLVQRIRDEFPFASEEKAKELVPTKSSCTCMKLVLYSGDIVNVYTVDAVPVMIETPEGLLPTVCALWKVPELVPMLNIHTPVLPKIQNGAPLYLPGVSLPAGGIGFPIFQAGTVMGARTGDNTAACLVGRAAISSADMLLRASGICLDIVHVVGDQLCKDDKFGKIERPKLAPPTHSADFSVNLAADIQQISLQPPREEWPSLGGRLPAPPAGPPAPPAARPAPPAGPPAPPARREPRVIADGPELHEEDVSDGDDDNDTVMEDDTSQLEADAPSDMDGLLRWSVLSFLKYEVKNVELPLKTNLFYKNYLHALCPADRSLDVKKSSYKKLSKFLEVMQQEGLLEVREVEKGVWAIIACNPAHEAVRRHLGRRRAAPAPPPARADYTPPRLRDVLCVTAAVQDLLAPAKKGTPLSPSEVRAAVTEYVRRHQLPSSRGAVTLDATLAKVTGKPEREELKWDALMSAVSARMTAGTELTHADGAVSLVRARLEPVKMAVASRSGNKKVTLVSNLESFGFKLPALAHECQLRAAATCGVTRAPGAKADQLMLQGDQTHFVAKLLIEKYGLPKKYLEGADKALNKKK